MNIALTLKTVVRMDTAFVRQRMDKLTRKAVNHLGALTRTIAMKTMPTDDGPSQPGHPPHSHNGKLRDLIRYGWDTATDSLVIGPLYTGSRRQVGKTVPETLEYGGFSRARGNQPPERIAARPFMRPALGKAVSDRKLKDAFAQAGQTGLLAQAQSAANT